MNLALWLQTQWQRRGWFAMLMYPLSLVYCVIMVMRRAAYRYGILAQQRVALPVIVVGNLSVGGSGKTPLVIWLAGQLARAGYRPGIVSRGYGGNAAHYPLLVSPQTPPDLCGDEAAMMAREVGCAVVVDPDRVAAANWLVQHHACDVILSDDGLQHLRLARDIEIIVINSDRVDGNGLCLPAGPLRERPAVLEGADFVVTRQPTSRRTTLHMRLQTLDCAAVDNPARRLPLTAFRQAPVHAVAGIGHPQVFFDTLRGAGLQVIPHAFADHHDYQVTDLEFAHDEPLLMTGKDAVKCRTFARRNWWAVTVEARPDAGILGSIIDRLEELTAGG